MYKLTRVAFGLWSAQNASQQIMNLIECECNSPTNLLDVIVLWDPTGRDTDHCLHKVIHSFSKDNLNFNQEKSQFGIESLYFVGHSISSHSVKTQQSKVDGLLNIKRATIPRELLSFLAISNIYLKFVSHYD